MKTKHLLSLILSASMLSFASCEDCTEIYKTTGMNVNLVNDSLNAVIDTNETVSYENIFVGVRFEIDYEHFCPEGFATDSRFQSSIKSFTVTSDKEYNSEYPAGSVLNKMLDVSYCYVGCFENSEPIPFEEYLDNNGNCQLKFLLYLTEPPDTTRLHRFTIDYAEENGQSYQFTTHPIQITP